MRNIYGTLYTIKPHERGIQETLGKYTGFIMPGLGFQIPFLQIVRVRDIREHTMDIPPQSVITKDNVEIRVDGVMWVRPASDEESIKKTFYNIDNWKRAVVQLAMTNLRQEFGDLTLDESLVAREKIANNLQAVLNKFADEWGLLVSKVEIMLIDPPDDIKRAMHKQKTAEQERRAMRLLATGEFEAAEQQKLAMIQRAEGEREAAIKVAEGKAEAIRLVNEAAEKYFHGNAQVLKQIEMTEEALRDNAKIIITDEGVSPTLLLGSLPVSVSQESSVAKPRTSTKEG
jgi:regulator of protease activity HflC (stomatin/prohibitin superfamily)